MGLSGSYLNRNEPRGRALRGSFLNKGEGQEIFNKAGDSENGSFTA